MHPPHLSLLAFAFSCSTTDESVNPSKKNTPSPSSDFDLLILYSTIILLPRYMRGIDVPLCTTVFSATTVLSVSKFANSLQFFKRFCHTHYFFVIWHVWLFEASRGGAWWYVTWNCSTNKKRANLRIDTKKPANNEQHLRLYFWWG